jgi:5-hydroxyisourate hydrolase
MTQPYARLSTHVLDTARGEPAPGVRVRLERADDDGWTPVAEGTTDGDGRLRDWVPAAEWARGAYRLVFDPAARHGRDAFFPEIAIAFRVAEPGRSLHIPLLLSPYGYTVYRGS